MWLLKWESTRRLLPLAVMLCTPHLALGQEFSGEAHSEQISADGDEEDQRIQAHATTFAESLNKRERSEWINLKSYSDEEWERAENAVAANLAACDKGDARACKTAGDAYVSGDGVWPVPAIAYILYKEACDAGEGVGCRAYIELTETGYGYPDGDREEEAGLIEKACELGDLVACDRYANELQGQDLARSDATLEKACTAGGDEACLSLGARLVASGRPEDNQRGIEMWDAMCRTSVVSACQAMVLLAKNKPEPDEARAALYLHLSCYLESASDCVDMGDRAYRGNGVAENRDLAMAYYDKACQIDPGYCEISETLRAMPALRRACRPDDAQACTELGRALSYSLSPEFDRETALALLQSGCRQGLGDACLDAVEITRRNYSWNDPARSAPISEMLERGCEADNLDACFKLADALELGELGTTNVELSADLFNRLCDAGSLEACDRASKYAGSVPGDLPAPMPEMQTSRWSFETEICLTQNEIFRGKTYSHENCPRTEKGIRSNRALRDEAPWQALLWRPEILNGIRLGVTQRVACGGTLIKTGWVLTAAHCLTDNKTNIRTGGHRIRLGVFNPQVDEGISYPILRTIPHPQYDASENYVFDIALIQYDPRAGRVGRASDADSVRRRNAITPVTLDPLEVGQRKIVTGMPAYSYGWGWTETEKSKSSNYLQIVTMEMKSETACTAQTKFVNEMGDAALCVGGKNGAQMCYGDSGGPLVLYGNRGARAILIGVVSAGKQCGATGLPSQYTRVAKVKSWIKKYVKGIP
jgi:TPR repeat protein